MFYQQQPYRDNYLRIQEAGDWSIQTHMHTFYELLWCEYGQLQIVIADEHHVLHPGEAVLLFPYQPHSYPTEQKGQGWCCTFGTELIGSFASQYANYMPKSNKFRFSTRGLRVVNDSDIFAKKAFLYNVCSQAATQLEFEYASAEGRLLLEKIFLLTEAHYRESEFTLQALAELLKYDYGYISKYFLQKTGMKYNYYLNLRRITQAGRMFRDRQAESIAEVAYACGYSSVRSFNRNFKIICDKTPQEYIRDHVQNK
ncbi:MAG: helix-turn-helix transcriptional regulator [Oscillospiraceae bacterium]|nr:helix-turn-helix transcriptional regulator [Oscillospiraceae bacterium]